MQSDAERLKVLEQLESGDIDFENALSALQGAAQGASSDKTSAAPTTRRSWLIPFYFGVVSMGLGAVLGNQGGAWWLLAVPLLLVGLFLTIGSLASRRSPWLHLRVHNTQRAWPKTIKISFPLPMRLAAWTIRTIGPFIPDLDEQSTAQMLMALELGRALDDPLTLDVEGPGGERVELYLG